MIVAHDVEAARARLALRLEQRLRADDVAIVTAVAALVLGGDDAFDYGRALARALAADQDTAALLRVGGLAVSADARQVPGADAQTAAGSVGGTGGSAVTRPGLAHASSQSRSDMYLSAPSQRMVTMTEPSGASSARRS